MGGRLRAKQTARGWKERQTERGECTAAKMKDNTINKIYKITNNALGISLIVTWAYYAERRFIKAGSLWLALLKYQQR